ncbi:MAG TPA: MASE1 domain-containing protein [Burkholderiales bacterium]|nr:MASE1 domain-containing protein [Burkholderiales bacterium]
MTDLPPLRSSLWRSPQYVGRVALLATVYFVVAKAALLLAIPPGYATAVWPPSGIALAAVLLAGARIWPGVWLGAALTNLTIQGSPLLAVLIGTGNTLEAVVAAALVRRYINAHGEFESGEAAVMFAAMSALSALIAATIGTVSLTLAGTLNSSGFGASAWIWFEGDFTGMIIVAPLILSWRLRPLPTWNTNKSLEGAVLAISMVSVTVFIFRNLVSAGVLPLVFITLPFVLWAAIRFEQRVVAAAIAAMSAISVWYMLQAEGQFGPGFAKVSSFFLLSYTSTLMMTGLVMSAIIGQRKRAELAVRQRVDELQASERHINEFLAMLSHELRNPLAPMVNALALIRKVPATEHSPLLGIIERQVAHLSHIVDDLLDVSRITRGKILLQKALVDLKDIVLRAVEASRPLIAAHGHAVESHLPDEQLLVDVDATRISQVVLNLINNAVKYTPAGGSIAISVSRESGYALLKVRDSGIGIGPELIPKVFDLFMQGDRALDRSEGGLGIGLTIARRIVEMHGGSIDVSSGGPGNGSEFSVRIPLAQASASAVPVASRDSGAAPRAVRRRLLIVDDHRENADTLATLLASLGHEVFTAYDGRKAIELAQQLHPDAVLLDIGLPGMNGYEVARALRNSQGMRMFLIAVSGYGQDEDRRRSREAGFNYHLVKPVDPARLGDIIDSLGADQIAENN